jgi:hypothetical protein
MGMLGEEAGKDGLTPRARTPLNSQRLKKMSRGGRLKEKGSKRDQ